MSPQIRYTINLCVYTHYWSNIPLPLLSNQAVTIFILFTLCLQSGSVVILILFCGAGTALPTNHMNALPRSADRGPTKTQSHHPQTRSADLHCLCWVVKWAAAVQSQNSTFDCITADQPQNSKIEQRRNNSLHKSIAAVPVRDEGV